jgi:NAD(P)-dependent dehydrogenase (short-subunit alcohol dehydrogenase family)
LVNGHAHAHNNAGFVPARKSTDRPSHKLFTSSTSTAAIDLLSRIGRPKDIAPAAVYLASDESSWVTGETHTIAGGVHG